MSTEHRNFTMLEYGAYIKLPSEVLHKIYIEINVYFMQDF